MRAGEGEPREKIRVGELRAASLPSSSPWDVAADVLLSVVEARLSMERARAALSTTPDEKTTSHVLLEAALGHYRAQLGRVALGSPPPTSRESLVTGPSPRAQRPVYLDELRNTPRLEAPWGSAVSVLLDVVEAALVLERARVDLMAASASRADPRERSQKYDVFHAALGRCEAQMRRVEP